MDFRHAVYTRAMARSREIGEEIKLRSHAAPLGLGITERRLGLGSQDFPGDKGTQRAGMP